MLETALLNDSICIVYFIPLSKSFAIMNGFVYIQFKYF